MENKDFERFSNALLALSDLYDKPLSAATQDLYFNALKKYSIEDIEKAASIAIQTLKFFPKPVELIECITGGQAAANDKAVLWANKALDSIKKIGKYQSVLFNDPVATAVITITFGGWINICQTLVTEKEIWFLKDFEKAYMAFLRQGTSIPGHMAGIAENENRNNGLEFELKITKIGLTSEPEIKTIAIGPNMKNIAQQTKQDTAKNE